MTQELVKARGQRHVLVTEIRNMRTQTEGQIAVAMAEAKDHEKKLQGAQQEFKHQTQGFHL
ncbi:conserved hypothetical protein [Plasmopara halstedii]|uniref:Uncharacterized protein n=1 Tax=Plasmopara halstedii TaxID=4781 RepID=A0A0P1ADA6_PLAHL|nr:conserved hypothetical protein [Plasmopara halstedii]CEG38418.1 conserved hypothetical protein [Plasmopara halstedii]|eukprot:XP_024574787.1 conserved hypothetical protein [Plasmopara halstedii]